MKTIFLLCVGVILGALGHQGYCVCTSRPDESRFRNIRPYLDQQEASVMFVVGYSPAVESWFLHSDNFVVNKTNLVSGKRLADKSEAHILTVHDKGTAAAIADMMIVLFDYFSAKRLPHEQPNPHQ